MRPTNYINAASIAKCRYAISAWQRKKSIVSFRCMMRDSFTHWDNAIYDWMLVPYRVYRIVRGTISGKYARINAEYHYVNCK